MKKLLLILATAFCASLQAVELPQTIHFSSKSHPLDPNLSAEIGIDSFNRAPEIGIFLGYLKSRYQIDTAVETGTYLGRTSIFLSFLFSEVHTIEVMPQRYQDTKAVLDRYPGIHCHLGSSEKVLKKLLPKLEGRPVLFYLDAHWYDHWPLLEELDEIAKTHRDNCIIVIDDFKVPHLNFIPYDKYKEHECSLAYIQEKLDGVFSEYSYHYLIPKNPRSRAKFVAIAKSFSQE